MEKAFPEDYNFVPGTWILPAEYPFFAHSFSRFSFQIYVSAQEQV
jgi:hypothetical protein